MNITPFGQVSAAIALGGALAWNVAQAAEPIAPGQRLAADGTQADYCCLKIPNSTVQANKPAAAVREVGATAVPAGATGVAAGSGKGRLSEAESSGVKPAPALRP